MFIATQVEHVRSILGVATHQEPIAEMSSTVGVATGLAVRAPGRDRVVKHVWKRPESL